MSDDAETIRTERLLLRPFLLQDAEDVFAYASDKVWSRFLPLPNPYTRKHADEFVARCVLDSRDSRHTFAIDLQDRVVGAIELAIDDTHRLGSLHYAIARDQWNRGFMTEAARAVTDWGFKTHGLSKVYSWASVQNVGSWRVMEKIGMKREGCFRKHMVVDGERHDFYYYAVLREEWNGANNTS